MKIKSRITAAAAVGTTFYKITEDQLKKHYEDDKNILMRYLVAEYGFDAFDISQMYGSYLDTSTDTLYLCVTDGQSIQVPGSEALIDPEFALENFSESALEDYIADGTDEIISRYVSAYELKAQSGDVLTDAVNDGYEFVEVLEAALDLDAFTSVLSQYI